MPYALRLLGALVVTYFLSRLTLRFSSALGNGAVRILVAHAVSFAIIALTVGFMRAYFVQFEWRAAVIYIAPQLAWLILDLVRGSEPLKRSATGSR